MVAKLELVPDQCKRAWTCYTNKEGIDVFRCYGHKVTFTTGVVVVRAFQTVKVEQTNSGKYVGKLAPGNFSVTWPVPPHRPNDDPKKVTGLHWKELEQRFSSEFIKLVQEGLELAEADV